MAECIKEARVERRQWDNDDSYLVVCVQVDETKFKSGDKVKVVISSEKKEGN